MHILRAVADTTSMPNAMGGRCNKTESDMAKFTLGTRTSKRGYLMLPKITVTVPCVMRDGYYWCDAPDDVAEAESLRAELQANEDARIAYAIARDAA